MAEEPASPFASLDTSLLRSTQARPAGVSAPGSPEEHVGAHESDRWLPLKDAAFELAIPETAVHRFIADGRLESRTVGDNVIEVRVRQVDRTVDVSPQPVEVIEPPRSRRSPGSDLPVSGQTTELQMASVVASLQRNADLAHENGVLTATNTSLEQELARLRESSTLDTQMLAQVRKRLEATEAANGQLTRMLVVRDEEASRPQRGTRFLWAMLGILLLVVLIQALAINWRTLR